MEQTRLVCWNKRKAKNWKISGLLEQTRKNFKKWFKVLSILSLAKSSDLFLKMRSRLFYQNIIKICHAVH
jgi:hypothetical protein